MVLVNSFWGLDSAMPVPPNLIVTGPLMKDQGDLMAKLEEKDPQLLEWMNDAKF